MFRRQVVVGTVDGAPGGAGPAADQGAGRASRRERVRAATIQEIMQTARRFLVEQGPDAVTLRAIAREMGMTAPALYRYFGSHDELVRHVMGDIYLEIADGVQAAIDGAPDDLAAKLAAAAREFRRWSLTHGREFGLVFATPMPAVDLEQMDIAQECGLKFCGTFLTLFLELWQQQPFRVPAAADIDPGLRAQLERFRELAGAGDLPTGAILSFVYSWVRLYGMVSMEVYGQLSWVLDDAEPIFEMMLREIMPVLGLQDPAPQAGRRGAVFP
jgi:AcrR family transcriptional regulator